MPFKRYAPGGFCWAELATTDQSAAFGFYSELFGWSCEDVPMPHGGVYSVIRRDGKRVAGIYSLEEELRARGVPSHWRSYVAVNDVDAALAKARSLGATPFCEPFDVAGVGRMAMFQDPAGAILSLWQEKRVPDEELPLDGPGVCCWHELLTTNTAAAEQFYGALFGWTAKTESFGDITYTTFSNAERGVGGMLAIKPEWGPMPPHWGVYFSVLDCDERLVAAQRMGATACMEPHDIPRVGRFATAQDPQGAMFSIIALLPMAQ